MMNGFMIAFATIMLVTFNVAAGQNTTKTCSDDDVAELNRLVTELNSCDPCEETEEEDECRCCALYASVLALQELCQGSATVNKRGDVNVIIDADVLNDLKKVCRDIFDDIFDGASTMAAGTTVIAFTAIAATMF